MDGLDGRGKGWLGCLMTELDIAPIQSQKGEEAGSMWIRYKSWSSSDTDTHIQRAALGAVGCIHSFPGMQLCFSMLWELFVFVFLA